MMEIDGCWVRAIADAINPNDKIIFDLKSTAGMAKPEAWLRESVKFGVHTRVAHYKQLFGEGYTYLFLVCEKSPPYAVSVIELGMKSEAIGYSQCDYARKLWVELLKLKTKWPAYENDIIAADIPEWMVYDWIGKMSSKGISDKYGVFDLINKDDGEMKL